MKLCRDSLTLVLAVFAVSISTAQEPVDAWWLHAKFVPNDTEYQSLAVAKINPNWLKISILSFAALPPESRADVIWMHRNGFDFEVADFFKRKNLIDRELCGVFEDRAGRKGRFLLVLERRDAGPWKVAFLHQEYGQPGFSVLLRNRTRLYWGTCMRCGEFNRLRLKQGHFYLEPAN